MHQAGARGSARMYAVNAPPRCPCCHRLMRLGADGEDVLDCPCSIRTAFGTYFCDTHRRVLKRELAMGICKFCGSAFEGALQPDRSVWPRWCGMCRDDGGPRL